MKYMIFFFATLFLYITPAWAERIVIVGDPWCPYNCEPRAEMPGFMIETARAIFKEQGIEVQYITMPWSRALDSVRKGEYDAVVGAFKEDAPDFVFPENSMVKANQGFFIKNGNPTKWHYSGIGSLQKVSAGFIRDYSYGKALDNYIKTHSTDAKKIQLTAGDNALEQNVKKLLAGRIEVVVEDRAVMQHFLNDTKQISQVKSAGQYPEMDSVYIAFAPGKANSARYAKILSEGIKHYKQSGKLKQIKAEYGVK